LAPRPNPKLKDHPLSAVYESLFDILAVTLYYLETVSSIRNPKMRHAVVTGAHIRKSVLLTKNDYGDQEKKDAIG
jgi:hypothetical protein